MIASLFDLLLCALILGVALACIGGRDLFGAVVFFIVYGLLVAIAWVRLDAIDVALAEAAIGAGLTGVLLLAAVSATARHAAAGVDTVPRWTRAVSGLTALAVAVALGYGFLALPAPVGLQQAVTGQLSVAGADNPVTAVLLNFRAWDTLLESIVLLAALVGVWALSTDTAWGNRPGARQHTLSGGVLAGFGRILPPLGLLVGVYLVWAGSTRPGGAFQGGTVLAAVWLLTVMAGLVEAPRSSSRLVRLGLVAGPALFLAIAAIGALAGGFLTLPADWAGGLILAIEAVLTLSIALTLGLLVLGPPADRLKGDAR